MYFMANVWYGHLFKYLKMMYQLQTLHNDHKLMKY